MEILIPGSHIYTQNQEKEEHKQNTPKHTLIKYICKNHLQEKKSWISKSKIEMDKILKDVKSELSRLKK